MLRKVPDAHIAALRQWASEDTVVAPPWRLPVCRYTLVEVIAELSRGYPRLQWCVVVFHAQSQLMGLFPKMAQRDSYGTDPDAIVSAMIAPRGKARAVDGGYVLNGLWPFASGCEHSQ